MTFSSEKFKNKNKKKSIKMLLIQLLVAKNEMPKSQLVRLDTQWRNVGIFTK